MGKKFYITTAIDYTNGAPHIGHAYEKVLADAMARFMRLTGREVYFLTGLDQHGQKVQLSAEKAGVPPEEFVRGVSDKFIELWKRLDVHPDGWVETTDPRHKRVVQAVLQQLFDAGLIYKKSLRGWYSVRQEQFLNEKDREADGTWGSQWGLVEEREEENYYFRLSNYSTWLQEFLAAQPDFVFPANRQTQLINAAKEGEGMDLCISRPVSRLSWGIPLPFDPGYVTFVWFDALMNYASFAGFLDADPDNSGLPCWEELWPCNAHVIGKDILIPAHGIYWPIMLKALGLRDDQMPKVLVHGFWNIDGRKYSKSEAVETKPLTVLKDFDPNSIADVFGSDGLRYFLLAEMKTGQDSDLTEDRILFRYNKELADILGNLLNRTLNMARKYLSGRISYPEPEIQEELLELSLPDSCQQGKAVNPDESFENWTNGCDSGPIWNFLPYLEDYTDNLSNELIGAKQYCGKLRFWIRRLPQWCRIDLAKWRLDSILQSCITTARLANELIDKTAPFKLVRDTSNAQLVAAIMRHVLESLTHISVLLSPAMPATARRIQAQLGWTQPEGFTLNDLKWGLLPDGHVLGEPQPLFPKVLPPAAV